MDEVEGAIAVRRNLSQQLLHYTPLHPSPAAAVNTVLQESGLDTGVLSEVGISLDQT